MFSNIQKLRSIDLTGLILPNESSTPPPHVPSTQQPPPQSPQVIQPQSKAISQTPPIPPRKISNSKTHHNAMVFEEDDHLIKNHNKPSIEDKEELSYPNLAIRRPYWKMRLICKSIRHGGFINSNIYVPQAVWYQDTIKFSGLAAKTSAYQAILSLLQNESFIISDDIIILEKMNGTIANLLEEFNIIQNQLWKPFPYIPEIKILNNPDELNTSAATVSSNVTTATTTSTVWQNTASTNTSSSGYGFSNMMSLLKKGVKKYAGLGLSRFNALPTYLTIEEVTVYVRLMATLCTAVQVFDKLYDQCITLQEKLTTQYGEVDNMKDSVDFSGDANSNDNKMMNYKINREKYKEPYRKYEILQLMVDNLNKISLFMRVAVCEIMMRDTEVFVTKYIQRLTKGFTQISENEIDIDDSGAQQQVITTARIDDNSQHSQQSNSQHSHNNNRHSHKITSVLEAVLLGDDSTTHSNNATNANIMSNSNHNNNNGTTMNNMTTMTTPTVVSTSITTAVASSGGDNNDTTAVIDSDEED